MDIEKLKAIREKLGLTQQEVAEGIGLRRVALSFVEGGHIRMRDEELNAYAAFLSRKLEEIKQIQIPQEVTREDSGYANSAVNS